MVRVNGSPLATVDRRRAGNIVERRGAGGRSPYQTWSYDELGSVTSHQVYAMNRWVPWLVTGERVEMDALGNVRSSRDLRTGIALRYTYDAQHQLATVASEPQANRYAASFEYTPGGRLDAAYVGSDISGTDVVPRDVSYGYDGSSGDPEWVRSLTDRTTGASFATYDYDPRGNRTVSSLASGEVTSFVHDGADELREAQRGPTSERYYYDHTGARVLVVSSAFESEPTRVRWYFGDTELWYRSDGAVEKTLAHVSLGGMPAGRIQNRTTVTTVYSGVRGDVLAALSKQGQLEAAFSYGPFGELLDVAGLKADEMRHRFNGKELDRLTRLSYYGARYYDRLSLTWTQADPLYRFAPDIALGDPRRMNLYTFVLNNPVRFVDPDGLDGDDKKSGVTTVVHPTTGTKLEIPNDKITSSWAVPYTREPLDGFTYITHLYYKDEDGKSRSVPIYEKNGGPNGAAGGSPDSKSAGHDEGQEGGEGSEKAHDKAQLNGPIGGIYLNQSQSGALDGATMVMMLFGGAAGALQASRAAASRTAARKGCFVAGTLVETANGLRPIEEVREGDLVLSQPEQGGSLELRRVSRTFVHNEVEIYEVTTREANGQSEVLKTTADHPFWVVGKGWTEVARMRPGDELLNAAGGVLEIEDIATAPRTVAVVYNIEVEEFHTYFVGELRTWVHNKPMNRIWTKKGRLKDAQLPTRGKVRYVPPKNWTPTQPLPRGSRNGYMDRFGNEWTKGPSRTKGQAFEWDVQLPNGKHWNISLDGKVTH